MEPTHPVKLTGLYLELPILEGNKELPKEPTDKTSESKKYTYFTNDGYEQ